MSGLPSIINGGRDFSVRTHDDAALYREFAKPVERALGADGVCLPDCAIAESALLRGEDVRARMLGITSKIQDIYLHGSPDIEFAATGLLARTQVTYASAEDACQTILKIRESFLARGEDFFIPKSMRCLPVATTYLRALRACDRPHHARHVTAIAISPDRRRGRHL